MATKAAATDSDAGPKPGGCKFKALVWRSGHNKR
jgi:hypothetical protein